MLIETALKWEGLADPDTFRNALRIHSYDMENDAGVLKPAVSMELPALGLSQEIHEEDEKKLTARTQQVLNEWISRWNEWQTVRARGESIESRNKAWQTLLTESLTRNHRVNLDAIRNTIPFESSEPYKRLGEKLASLLPPSLPVKGYTPSKPVYQEPEVSLSQAMLFRKKGIIRKYEEDYNRKFETWEKICEKIQQNYDAQMSDYLDAMNVLESQKQQVLAETEDARLAYEEERREQNEVADVLYINYQGRQPEAVEQYLEMAMQQSVYPDSIPRNAELEYHRDNRTLFVAMELPHPDAIPREKGLVSDAITKQYRITEYSPAERSALYKDIVFKFILRTFHELFAADEAEVVDAISLNAWVRTLNLGNGQYENICIATLFSSRAEFSTVNLAQVDPALCFRFLKGVSAPELSDLTPIPTQFTISKKTKEQVPTRKQLEPIDPDKNLANTGWVEFQNLMMELFGKEFEQADTDLKLIASSPENGVEAVGLDPDPVRGGRVIFVARRSTKPVSVSAVRELFGSVIHEGAIKGILASTADFTPEAYEFARNKPLSLLNGSTLLGLFEKHGYKLRINLREAVSLESWLS
jgi:restriction system protein